MVSIYDDMTADNQSDRWMQGEGERERRHGTGRCENGERENGDAASQSPFFFALWNGRKSLKS